MSNGVGPDDSSSLVDTGGGVALSPLSESFPARLRRRITSVTAINKSTATIPKPKTRLCPPLWNFVVFVVEPGS